jgi:phosphoribosylanthranilate isomerase
MPNVRVKICGITREADLDAAAEAGADMLGFVFATSPRQLTLEQAGALLARVPEGIRRVGLFMNPAKESVREVIERMPLDLLQFHGNESSDFCGSFGMPYIKAIAMGAGSVHIDAATEFPDAAGYLYDGHKNGTAGGSGSTFDWSELRQAAHPLWLAGGLTTANVIKAIELVQPWAVDVSSGVESAPGIKNHELMKAFITAAKSVQLSRTGQ